MAKKPTIEQRAIYCVGENEFDTEADAKAFLIAEEQAEKIAAYTETLELDGMKERALKALRTRVRKIISGWEAYKAA